MFKFISKLFKGEKIDSVLDAAYSVEFVSVKNYPVYYGLGGLKKVYTKIIIPDSELSKRSFTMDGAEHKYFSHEISKQEYDMYLAMDDARAINR